ncbi:hemolysin family protein [Nesterenkonia marinintestina]|uniref:hemolysin family protein n=1 Tax=Nesterenkonia marinintestina TaxID=2979865 RepID=UPI0021BFFC79|nr:hemolysin family protein [Nesterenkonia sp. GX14115]
MTLTLLIVGAALSAVAAAVLSLAEAAFMRLGRREAEEISADRTASAVTKILREPETHTVALQIWRALCTVAAVVLLTLAAVRGLESLPAAGLVVVGALALLCLGLAVVSPRRLGRQHHLVVARSTSSLVRVLRLILGPLPSWLPNLGRRIAPGASGAAHRFFDDEDEFREFVARASETDIIEDAEAELIQSVFDLSATRVRAVMVPRTDMVTVDAGTTMSEVMQLFLRSGYSRVPVVGDSADDVTGMVYLKDVAFLEHGLYLGEAPDEHQGRSPDDIPVDELQRDVRFVPESKAVSELLSELQRESTHVAVVVDEYGGTAGLVTLEDLIEEIVGEIVDEYDTEDVPVEDLEDGRRRISARMSVDDFAEIYDLRLDDEEEVDTVGGLLAKSLGRVPIAGSEVEIQGVVLRADRLEGRRNRVSHVLAWEVDEHRGARTGLIASEDEEAPADAERPLQETTAGEDRAR